MENDSVRSIGESTVVDIWLEGKLRGISVSREAIEAFLALPRDRAEAMSEENRREFVRTHMTLVAAAAKSRLKSLDPGADSVHLEAGHLGSGQPASGGDRRQGDRRKGERRKLNLPVPNDRRKGGDRRKT
ncbi:MAG TPA: hypothetical protein VJM15_11550 [Sphingomicrobium sp.]|nr:hypothetical protein [Sphingomicrobium sp.]